MIPDPNPGHRRVLGVGIAALDIVNELATYPAEDSEVRAIAQRRVRGGNCANTLAILAQLGLDCTWAGTLGDDSAAEFIASDLEGRGIDTGRAERIPGGHTPTSYVSLSRASGSRTIVHYRDLPELCARHFDSISLEGLDWIHFEGRNPPETVAMIQRCRRESPETPISLELEKPRPGIDALLDGPDLLLISRVFAQSQGAIDPRVYLRGLAGQTSASLLVVGWGAEGAWLMAGDGAPAHCPAHAYGSLLDTLGAGDVLNAGVIEGRLRGLSPPALVERAVRLAGLKCARQGLDGLAQAARDQGIL